jgi:hypothetical protein
MLRTDSTIGVFIRTGQSSTPIEEADWERTQWLTDRRKKSVHFRGKFKLMVRVWPPCVMASFSDSLQKLIYFGEIRRCEFP